MSENEDNTQESTGSGDGYEDPIPKRPVVYAAVAVTTASCVYVVDTVCEWVASAM